MLYSDTSSNVTISAVNEIQLLRISAVCARLSRNGMGESNHDYFSFLIYFLQNKSFLAAKKIILLDLQEFQNHIFTIKTKQFH